MRFAITGIDMYHGIFRELLAAGWQPVKMFTWPTSDLFDFNRTMLAHASELKIPIQISRMKSDDLADLKARGCEILVSAGYNWRIPAWEEHLPYAINFHCSLLPDGRGAWPIPLAIARGYKEWGSSLHKISPEFDEGDILDQHRFPLSPDETHSSLVLKSQMAHRRLAHRLGHEFHDLWKNALPQGAGGSYWQRFTDADKTLDWYKTVAENMRIVRAFDGLEVIASVEDSLLHVRKVSGWQESHSANLGSVVHSSGRDLVIAVKDGFIALHAYSPLPLEHVEMLGR